MQRPTGTVSRSFAATTPARPPAAPQRALAAPATRSLSMSAPASPSRPLAAAPPPPSNVPSVELRRHHGVETPQVDAVHFRPGWRVHSRLASLAEAGRIDREQLEAAASWGRWAERTGKPRTSAWRIRVDGGSPCNTSLTDRQMDAAGRLRTSLTALGAARCALLHACVVEDQSFRQLGKRLGVAGETAKELVTEAIVALALWLAGEPVPPAPAVRFRNQPRSW